MSTHELEKKCAEYERVIQKLHHRIQTGWCPARVIIGMWRTYRARVGFLEMKYAAILISKTVRGHFARTNEYLLKRKDHHARLIHAAENLHNSKKRSLSARDSVAKSSAKSDSRCSGERTGRKKRAKFHKSHYFLVIGTNHYFVIKGDNEAVGAFFGEVSRHYARFITSFSGRVGKCKYYGCDEPPAGLTLVDSSTIHVKDKTPEPVKSLQGKSGEEAATYVQDLNTGIVYSFYRSEDLAEAFCFSGQDVMKLKVYSSRLPSEDNPIKDSNNKIIIEAHRFQVLKKRPPDDETINVVTERFSQGKWLI
jgi:hypothetical protein